jgi:hydrogenase maturation protein HypF
LPLVMTSGNLSEEPIARDNDEALRRLGAIADGFLMHNRDIYARYDDSVWFAPASGPQPIRRARGYAPSPVRLPFEMRPILACGAELKNTFCLTRDRYAFLSQHIGDLENLGRRALPRDRRPLSPFVHVAPEIVAYDMHPIHGHALWQEQTARRSPCSTISASGCLLADNGIAEPAIGVIWLVRLWVGWLHLGGEFLVGDGRGFQRAAHLQYLPLPGGDRATIKPYRVALAYHQALAGDDTLPESVNEHTAVERQALRQM